MGGSGSGSINSPYQWGLTLLWRVGLPVTSFDSISRLRIENLFRVRGVWDRLCIWVQVRLCCLWGGGTVPREEVACKIVCPGVQPKSGVRLVHVCY